MSRLKPCPFCGCAALWNEGRPACPSPTCQHVAVSPEAWNTRPLDNKLDVALAKLALVRAMCAEVLVQPTARDFTESLQIVNGRTVCQRILSILDEVFL